LSKDIRQRSGGAASPDRWDRGRSPAGAWGGVSARRSLV